MRQRHMRQRDPDRCVRPRGSGRAGRRQTVGAALSPARARHGAGTCIRERGRRPRVRDRRPRTCQSRIALAFLRIALARRMARRVVQPRDGDRRTPCDRWPTHVAQRPATPCKRSAGAEILQVGIPPRRRPCERDREQQAETYRAYRQCNRYGQDHRNRLPIDSDRGHSHKRRTHQPTASNRVRRVRNTSTPQALYPPVALSKHWESQQETT